MSAQLTGSEKITENNSYWINKNENEDRNVNVSPCTTKRKKAMSEEGVVGVSSL